MKLHEYINSFHPSERKTVRERIAKACGVANESSVKHWSNGTRMIPSRHIKAVVSACDEKVTIEDLLAN